MLFSQRLLHAINELALASKGSLWFIKEAIWRDIIPNYVVKRKAHPGLVFANKRYSSLIDTVPIMIGSSTDCSYNRGFPVQDVMPRSPRKIKMTFFTAIRPCAAPMKETSQNRLTINDFTGHNPNVSRNLDKSSLDAEEMRRLDDYLLGKGLHI